jgi:hypothetical protein
MERWIDGLSNRNADDDRSRIARHLIPRFGGSTIERMTLAEIMGWLDDLKKTKLSGQSAYSGRTRAPIPERPGHRFRYDAGAKSGATRALIPV